MGEYIVESKLFADTIGKCLGVIALGAKAEANSITLDFGKKTLDVEAGNSIAAYRSGLPVNVVKPTKLRATVMPEMLLAYCRSYKELKLIPSDENLVVKAGKDFSATLFYIGTSEPIVMIDADKDRADISEIADAANDMLSLVGGMRNRTDNQALGVMLEWDKGVLELTIGDTHHAVVIDRPVKTKDSGKVVMIPSNLQRIMQVGQNFAAMESHIVAWSDTEYLSIANQSQSVFIADAARGAIGEGSRKARIKVNTDAFKTKIDIVAGAIEDSAQVYFAFSPDRILIDVKTSVGTAKTLLKPLEYKAKTDQKVAVGVHHLNDCLSVIKSKEMYITLFANMLMFEAIDKKYTKLVSAMSTMGAK